MPALPWFKAHTEEITVAATAIIVAAITAKKVVTNEEAQQAIDGEKPLERATRRFISSALIKIGTFLQQTTFVTKEFGEQVGKTLTKLGQVIDNYNYINQWSNNV